MASYLDSFVRALAAVPTTDRLFNPYFGTGACADICRLNLRRYLEHMRALAPKVLLVGEAYGYRGARLTGVPFTSERILVQGVSEFGLFKEGFQAKSGIRGGVAEPTATMVWGALAEHASEPPLLWNCLPFHPHSVGNPLSNRAPTIMERCLGLPFLQALYAHFGHPSILAVGRSAQAAINELGWPYVPLRHPSHGGKQAFVAGLVAALGREQAS